MEANHHPGWSRSIRGYTRTGCFILHFYNVLEGGGKSEIQKQTSFDMVANVEDELGRLHTRSNRKLFRPKSFS